MRFVYSNFDVILRRTGASLFGSVKLLSFNAICLMAIFDKQTNNLKESFKDVSLFFALLIFIDVLE